MSSSPRATGPTPPPVRAIWYVVTFAVYVALGVTLKSVVLNWIVGPLFPVLTLYVLPTLLRQRFGREARTR